jgi:diguanylate cyclase (GGDEF)-like protein
VTGKTGRSRRFTKHGPYGSLHFFILSLPPHHHLRAFLQKYGKFTSFYLNHLLYLRLVSEIIPNETTPNEPWHIEEGSFEEYRLIRLADLYENLAREKERRVQAEERADRDQHLNILNKSAFGSYVLRHVSYDRRESGPKINCLVVIDLDNFKNVNDIAGHKAGDKVLEHVTRQLRFSIREEDKLGRIDGEPSQRRRELGRLGGEEFGAFLPDTSLHGALQFADRFREALQEVKRPNEYGCMTASIGIVELPPGGNFDDALEAADRAMYTVKQSGRDGVATRALDRQAVDGTLHYREIEIRR